MRFLIDENLPRQIFERLTRDGYELAFVRRIHLGLPDEKVLGLAEVEQILITEDKDFGELVFHRGIPTQGVVLVRLGGFSLDMRAEAVADAIKQRGPQLLGAFTVVGHGGVRHHRLGMPRP